MPQAHRVCSSSLARTTVAGAKGVACRPLLALSRHQCLRRTCPLLGGKADMSTGTCPLFRSLLGVKRTCVAALHESAFDPKRTFAAVVLQVELPMPPYHSRKTSRLFCEKMLALSASGTPMTSKTDDPEFWASRAEEVRVIAELLKDEGRRALLLRVAEDYDLLAALTAASPPNDARLNIVEFTRKRRD